MSTIDAIEERDQALIHLREPFQAGQTYYLVERSWWEQWCAHVGIDADDTTGDTLTTPCQGSRPGPIDNSDLGAEDSKYGELKKGLVEHRDFELVISGLWDLFAEWYGGGPAFPRNVVAIGLRQQEMVEMYPVFLRVLIAGDDGEPINDDDDNTIEAVSLYSELADLIKSHNLGGLDGKEFIKDDGRAWIFRPTEQDSDPEWQIIESSSVTIDSFEFKSGDKILLDYKTQEGQWRKGIKLKANWRDFQINDIIDAMDTQNDWYQSIVRDVKDDKILVHYQGWSTKWDAWIPRDSDSLAQRNTHTTGVYKSRRNGDSVYGANLSGAPPIKGAVGLRNLGNTCFMNSTLQCLSNTPILTTYFTDGSYEKEINRNNPLGWNGKVAMAYGELVKELWSGEYRVVAPSQFKTVIGEFQPRFMGWQQHDSSELLHFLLDGLHEDLNRVHEKPATNTVESDGRPDEVVAAEAWAVHRKRNRSVIVDYLQGQFKSTVVCPDCDRTSVTFDPFMFLSVPMPGEKSEQATFTISRKFDGSGAPVKPYQITLSFPSRYCTAAEIKRAAAAELGIKQECMMLTEVERGVISRVFARNDERVAVGHMYDDFWLIEHEKLIRKDSEENKNGASATLNFQVVNKRRSYGSNFVSFGAPFVITLERDQLTTQSVSELRQKIRNAVAPFLKNGWQDGVKDTDYYSVMLMNKDGRNLLAEIPTEDAKVNLIQNEGASRGFSFGLIWENEALDQFQQGPYEGESNSSGGAVNIYDCLDLMCQKETLEESEAWYCSKCKEHKCATKQFKIWRNPDVLILHMKRFKYTRNWRDKIDTDVDFPLEGLDISKWKADYDHKAASDPDNIYDLYAISNHFGGMGGGHYTAFAKNLIDGNWYNLDDSSVSQVSPNTIKSSAAYVLFYRRRNAAKLDVAGGALTAQNCSGRRTKSKTLAP